METKLLIIPGLGDSGKDHWQTYWLKKYTNATKLIQDNWNEPQLKDWLDKLNEAILKLNQPTILIAHSLGVSLVLHWLSKNSNPNIIGALLVAPADVDSPDHTPKEIWNFAPIPTAKLHFPAIVVSSENDPYIPLQRAKELAEIWGSDFINIGQKGHINSESNLEYWEEGQLILQQLMDKINNTI